MSRQGDPAGEADPRCHKCKRKIEAARELVNAASSVYGLGMKGSREFQGPDRSRREPRERGVETVSLPWIGDPGLKPGAKMVLWRKEPWTEGSKVYSKGLEPDAPAIKVGSPGVVREVKAGEPAHPCPDHEAARPDCVCGNEDAIIPAREPYASVEFAYTDGSTRDLAMRPSGENDSWRWACVVCGKTKLPEEQWRKDWTWNGGQSAHKRCALGMSEGARRLNGFMQTTRPAKQPTETAKKGATRRRTTKRRNQRNG